LIHNRPPQPPLCIASFFPQEILLEAFCLRRFSLEAKSHYPVDCGRRQAAALSIGALTNPLCLPWRGFMGWAIE